jgi:hypothetical protein
MCFFPAEGAGNMGTDTASCSGDDNYSIFQIDVHMSS